MKSSLFQCNYFLQYNGLLDVSATLDHLTRNCTSGGEPYTGEF
jgi:hypothetical protein